MQWGGPLKGITVPQGKIAVLPLLDGTDAVVDAQNAGSVKRACPQGAIKAEPMRCSVAGFKDKHTHPSGRSFRSRSEWPLQCRHPRVWQAW